ncbi:MAG TPA: GGDEF domain-containing protein [Candidatus Angelobacter sp.]|nr:GGDEF domain-containing protein [Candidatus Angelobacter sp.]
MPIELTIIAVTALLAGLFLVGITLAGRDARLDRDGSRAPVPVPHASPPRDAVAAEREQHQAESTLRVVWWLTVTIVLLGVGISGSFAGGQGAIFLLGAAAVVAVVLFHELGGARRAPFLRPAELVVAVALIGGLLALTGFASSPFAMLFALVAVAAALAYGPRAGLAAAGLATLAYAGVLLADPRLATYGPEDALRLSLGLVATWLLAFVAIAYAAHLRRSMAQAITLSQTDPLTGLSNRSQLHATLEREVSRTRRSDRGFCVLMIDLDGLKAINDTAGHLRGDEVLRAIGAIITGSIRAVDSAYRFGGDEFVVLLPETDIIGAFVVAEKIRIGAEEVGSTIVAGAEPVTSVSIGLVSHPEDGVSADELMIAADRAMYQAKRLGKNQISGNPRPRPALLGRRATAPATEPAAEPAAVEPAPEPPAEAPAAGPADEPAARHGNGVAGPRDDRAVAVELGPVVVAEPPSRPDAEEDDQADPQEVRRQIAAASRAFDPDHQVRRAMDAFFSPSSVPTEPDRTTPDH